MANPSVFLSNHIEALIFCSPQPLAIADMAACLSEMLATPVPLHDVESAVAFLLEKYQNDQFGIEIVKLGGGYQMLTKPAYQSSVSILLKQNAKKRLSTAALETIAIIAYRQPITKAEIEQIRGVGCDYAIQKLLEKELIEIKGKSESVGRPLLYGTSAKFMNYFGINSLKDLPMPKDIADPTNEIGDAVR